MNNISRGSLCTIANVYFIVFSAVSGYLLPCEYAWGEELDNADDKEQLEFDPLFLNGGAARSVDLKRFSEGNNIEPGEYSVDIYVNDVAIGNSTMLFEEVPKAGVMPCFKQDLLLNSGVNINELSSEIITRLKNDECIPVKKISQEIGYRFDYGEQRLDLSVPQILLQNKDRNYVRPELWDRGITAGLVGYNANYYTTRSSGITNESAYVGINSGFNVLGWNFRHNGALNWQSDQGSDYQSINTYVQRDIIPLKGRLTVGENSTGGQVFDSIPYRGVELQDDERMLPSDERGYAPEVRGIARTNAKVTVRQNNLVIYETTVAPGAFAINDIYASGYGSNLQVTVTEADGSTQTFEVPFASVAQLLRPGAQHYDFIVARYNDTAISQSPLFYQATYQRGLTNLITLYGGAQFRENYLAVQMGSALNTFFGAVAFDITQANAKFDHSLPDEPTSASGQSYRISYSKYITATDSNFAIAAYRFSTKNYLDFKNAIETQDALEHNRSASSVYRPKSRISITANQGLPEGWGQIYISGFAQNYWNSDTNSDFQYQLGYSTTWHSATLGLNASRTRNNGGDMETAFMFTVSMPLSGGAFAPQFNGSFTRDGQGNTGEQMGLSGSFGNENQYNYGLSATDYSNSSPSYNVNGQYLSSFTRISGNYGKSKDYSNASVGLTGTLLGYSGGIMFSPYVSDSFAIVEAKGATGASISTLPGTKVDYWGHAAVPYLNPYQINEIALDPKGMSDNAELDFSSQTVVPQAGAVVKVKYNVQQGYPILMNVSIPDGSTLPFGADVFNSEGRSVGTVGQGGQIYARVDKAKDTLHVKWGESRDQNCNISYIIPAVDDETASKNVIRFNSQCK
ncbi:fimbria/pilus outer membrane usher protein [Atlantibacter hermannii]|nr:fimbria/pilus outer membrane usher protein [Atlantibacter hermannii]NBC97807.1 fimbria/pilus outer membrane usher protein [Atlantibacter hermannii]